MSIIYGGEHSITFYVAQDSLTNLTPTTYASYVRTWKDLHLVPLKRPSISASSPSIKLIQIPGSSKRIDLTDLQPGGLKYGTRKGKWSFIVDNDKWNNWYIAKKNIESLINGKRLYCVLDDDSSYAYRGRFSVSDWKTEKEYSTISIRYELEYKEYINNFNSISDDDNNKLIGDWIEVDEAIKDGSYSTKYKIGDYIYLDIANQYNGYAEIVGFNVDRYGSAQLAPITFMTKGILNTSKQMNSSNTISGGYASSSLRSYVNGLLTSFPGRLQSMILEVTKFTYVASGNTSNLLEKIWIPSMHEISGQSYETSGPVYFTTYAKRMKTKYVLPANPTNSDINYWTRSVYPNSYYMYVDGSTGNMSGYTPTNQCGIVLGFCVGAST